MSLQAFSFANQQKSAIAALETKKTLQEEALNWVKARAPVNTCFRFSLLSMLFFSSKTGLLVWKEDIKYGQREVQKYEEGIREVEAEIGKLKRRTYVEPFRS